MKQTPPGGKNSIQTSMIIMGIGTAILIAGILIGYIYKPDPATRFSEGLRGITPIAGVIIIAVGALVQRSEKKKKKPGD